MRWHVTQILLLGTLWCISAGAQAAFITDKIVVDVYSQRFDQGTVLKKIPSGTAVEVLLNDGQYTRIRTPDNVTGWIASQYLTNEKPTQLEYLELLAKAKTLESELKAAQEKLAAAPEAVEPSLGAEELADLQQRAKDAAWMRVELKKARDRADELEAKVNAKTQTATASQQELNKLRADNKALEERLAAAMLVNEQAPTEEAVTTEPTEAADGGDAPLMETATDDSPRDDGGWRVNMEWFFGSLVVTLIAGFIIGISWLDKRIRQRHGGFRIY